MSPFLVILLRVLHIACGAAWFGAMIVVTFFLMPSIGAAGPAGGAVMKQMVDRKYPEVVMALMGITVLSGIALMWWSSAGFSPQWMASGFGKTLSFGGALAIVSAVYGVIVARPTAMRMAKIAGEMQSPGAQSPELAAEMKKLQAKMVLSTRIVALGLTVAVAAMAAARYM